MPPAISHLVVLPWTIFSLGRYDWFLKAGKVYLHWSHSADLRLSAISCEFNHIYSDGFHMMKHFHTLQILKLSFLFLQRTNRTAVSFIRATARGSSWNAFYFVVKKWPLISSMSYPALKSSSVSGAIPPAQPVLYRAVAPGFSAPPRLCIYAAERKYSRSQLCPSLPAQVMLNLRETQVEVFEGDTGGGV